MLGCLNLGILDSLNYFWGLATLLEGASLAFDIQKCLKFQKLIMVVLKLWSKLKKW